MIDESPSSATALTPDGGLVTAVPVTSVVSYTYVHGEPQIVAPRNEADGTKALRIGSPSGHTENITSPAGVRTLEKRGKLDIDQETERLVSDVLIDVLTREGHRVRYAHRASRDDDGEDAVLIVGQDEVAVQVTGPHADGLRHPRTTVDGIVTPETASRWIEEAILLKNLVPIAARRGVILAIDVRHLAVLSWPLPGLLDFLLQRPTDEVGWAGVYLIGALAGVSYSLVPFSGDR